MRTPLALLILLGVSTAHAQEPKPIVVPEIHPTVIGGSINEISQQPPDMTLVPRAEGARAGRIWVRNIEHSLLIFGEVEGGEPDFPRNKNFLLSKDHIEVWLAAGDDPDMPDIGWGNQFGETLLPKGDDPCSEYVKQAGTRMNQPAGAEAKCREWLATQQHYRPFFSRLFIRQWLLTPDYAVESFAMPAYEEITAKFASDLPRYREEVPEILKPHGVPQIWVVPKFKGGYTFQILIPYSFFPPLPELELRNLRLLVDVFSPAPAGKKTGPYSTSSPARVWGKPATFNSLRLDPPRVFHLTPCDMPLKGADAYRDVQDAWFIPKAGQSWEYESNAFLVVNGSGGYRYEPEGRSPVVRPLHFFWRNVSPGEWVCGPQLTYRKDGKSTAFDQTIAEEGFETRRAADGDLLIKIGPRVYYSEFGSGQCGACPRTSLLILGLTKEREIYTLLELGDMVTAGPDSPQAEDFALSPDWSQITQYDQAQDDEGGNPGEWSSKTWCLQGPRYKECGSAEGVQPPNPPVLKELRSGSN